MKILCVEDGSVDIDELENGELRDGKVLVYRQGSKPPFVLEIPDSYTEMYQKFLYVWEQLKEYLINTLQEKKNSPKYFKFADVLEKMEELEEIWGSNPPTRR